MTPWPEVCTLCTAHAGFLGSWTAVKSQVESVLASATADYPSYKLVATGHSLGAAVATLAAADLRQNAGFDVTLVGSNHLHARPFPWLTRLPVHLRLPDDGQPRSRGLHHSANNRQLPRDARR